jgi:putative DNA primase/helicase
MNIFSIFEQLQGFKQTGKDQYQACCPAHDDNKPSLSIGIGEDGRILVNCKAGCPTEDVCVALGIEMKDLFPDAWDEDSGCSPPMSEYQPAANISKKEPSRSTTKNSSSKAEIVATYDYVDETGKLLYQVVRYQPKGFRQRRPDGNGEWSWSVKGVRRVPYNLQELLVAEDVFIVEGENDVHTLKKMGLAATTSSGGAGNFKSEYSKYFNKNQKIVIIPDNDEPGRKYAHQWAAALVEHVASIKILDLPDLPVGGDVSDWAEGHDPQEAGERLCILADGAPEYSEKEADTGMWAGQIHTLEEAFKPRQKRQYLVTRLIPLPSLTIVFGAPGGFKSLLIADLATCVAAGLPWLSPLPQNSENERN